MTYTLAATRSEVAEQLQEAGIEAMDYIPEVLNPPLAIVFAGDPYITLNDTEKKTFKDVQVRLEVRVVAGRATNEVATDTLDDLICQVLIALGNWDLQQVSQPFSYAPNGDANATYLAADVVLTANITIEEVA